MGSRIPPREWTKLERNIIGYNMLLASLQSEGFETEKFPIIDREFEEAKKRPTVPALSL
jgi:hypothetical protein